MDKKDIVPLICLVTLSILTIFTSFNPESKIPWLLEAGAVWIFALFFILSYRKIRFPNYIYVLVTLFMFLPIIGGYYSFDLVPYGEILDFSGNGINHFDRLVHFIFGLFLTPFIFILLQKTSNLKVFWLYLIPFMLIMACGAIYEVIEWSSALVLSPDSVSTWVGMKGDMWDTQKDMLLNGFGSLISTTILLLLRKRDSYNIKKT